MRYVGIFRKGVEGENLQEVVRMADIVAFNVSAVKSEVKS